jgi:hypothetical protein
MIMNKQSFIIHLSPNIIRIIKSREWRLVRNVAQMGKARNAYKILVTKHEWKRPLGRTMNRWEDDILLFMSMGQDNVSEL